jgi:hypothetical protein
MLDDLELRIKKLQDEVSLAREEIRSAREEIQLAREEIRYVKEEAKIEVAKNMLALKMPPGLIADVTGLFIEHVKALKDENTVIVH